MSSRPRNRWQGHSAGYSAKISRRGLAIRGASFIESLENRLYLTTAAYTWQNVNIGAGGFVDGIFYDPKTKTPFMPAPTSVVYTKPSTMAPPGRNCWISSATTPLALATAHSNRSSAFSALPSIPKTPTTSMPMSANIPEPTATCFYSTNARTNLGPDQLVLLCRRKLQRPR